MTKEEYEKAIDELFIRFNTSPKLYEKYDFYLLLKVLTGGLLELMTESPTNITLVDAWNKVLYDNDLPTGPLLKETIEYLQAHSYSAGANIKIDEKKISALGYTYNGDVESFAEGKDNEATGWQSHAEGQYSKAWKWTAHAEGYSSLADGNAAHAEGRQSKAQGNYSHSEGFYTQALSDSSHAEGTDTIASGEASHAAGYDTEASGDHSHSEGSSTIAAGVNSHSEGEGSKITWFLFNCGVPSSAHTTSIFRINRMHIHIGSASDFWSSDSAYGLFGNSDIDSANDLDSGGKQASLTTIAEITARRAAWIGRVLYNSEGQEIGKIINIGGITGFDNNSYPIYPVETNLASRTQVTLLNSSWIAIDRVYTFSNNEPIYVATGAFGMNAHSEGLKTDASGNNSHAEGEHTQAYGSNAHSEGYNTSAYGIGSHSEGNATQALGNYSHTLGYRTHAEGDYAIACGEDSKASGKYSISTGYDTDAENTLTTAIGLRTRAEAKASTAQGMDSKAIGIGSHAEGYNTVAGNLIDDISDDDLFNSKNFTDETIEKLSFCHAEGVETQALAPWSHTEGYKTIVQNENEDSLASHAEGIETNVDGKGSHAEGFQTVVDADYAHAEGNSSIANGEAAHAEGCGTLANHKNSHAEGYYTKTGSPYQHVSGKYNIPSSDAAFIVGNGSYGQQKNAFEVNWDGTINVLCEGNKVSLQLWILDNEYTVALALCDLNSRIS